MEAKEHTFLLEQTLAQELRQSRQDRALLPSGSTHEQTPAELRSGDGCQLEQPARVGAERGRPPENQRLERGEPARQRARRTPMPRGPSDHEAAPDGGPEHLAEE